MMNIVLIYLRRIYRLETEIRQLHQIITQLRNARKNTKETVDSALADRTSQQEVIDVLQREVSDLRVRYQECQGYEAENISIRDEVGIDICV